jgi:orotate phosphoribosyltransferase
MNHWKQLFEEQGAIWIHDGNPNRPHALLTSGLHSDGFVNCTFITQQPSLLQQIVQAPDGLAPLVPSQKSDWVIGSAFGAITLAHSVALQIGARAGFTEKDDEEMRLSRFDVMPTDRILVVEDTISTGGSTLKTIQAILKAGVLEKNVLPVIVCLVNRSGRTDLEGKQIRALLTLQIHTWQSAECPLCKKGSTAIRPKSHWVELTGLNPSIHKTANS